MVVILVSTTFLVQNQYYSEQVRRTGVHDNARAATQLMAAEIRSVMEDGITVAGKKTLTVRTPIVIAGVCNISGSSTDVYTVGGESAIDTAEVAGVALRDTLTGGWTYANANWSTINGSGGTPAASCATNGADTAGVASNFHRLSGLSGLTGMPVEGDLVMIFRETKFTIETSVMDTTTLGLFRQVYQDSTIEYATGIDTTAQFAYRVSGSFVDTVATGLDGIDVVRIVADSRKAAVTGGVDDVTFGWTVDISLRNVRSNE